MPDEPYQCDDFLNGGVECMRREAAALSLFRRCFSLFVLGAEILGIANRALLPSHEPSLVSMKG